MTKQTCPRCGTEFSSSTGWANAAVSTLIQAPAVPDMATQVRCPACQHLFANTELRPDSVASSRPGYTAGVVVALVVVGWALYQLLHP